MNEVIFDSGLFLEDGRIYKHINRAGRCTEVVDVTAQIAKIIKQELVDSLQAEPPTAYVVTRSEEHDSYVEEVFFNEDKATAYCKQFSDDEYRRNITKTQVTV